MIISATSRNRARVAGACNLRVLDTAVPCQPGGRGQLACGDKQHEADPIRLDKEVAAPEDYL